MFLRVAVDSSLKCAGARDYTGAQMRTIIFTVSVVLATCSSVLGVDCTLTPKGPTSIEGQWTGPLRSLSPIETELEHRFFSDLSVSAGEGPIELQFDYCGAFELDGDFSEHPFWEFRGIGWAMVGSPDIESTLLGNFLDPSPTSTVFLSHRASSTTEDLGDNAFRTNGSFDITGLDPGQYVIGVVGTYTIAEIAIGEPDSRVRQDSDFEFGFRLTILPEPAALMLFLFGGILALGTMRRR